MLKHRKATKAALAISLLLIVLWAIIGTNASIAWFKQDDSIVNTLNFGELDVKLYHKTAGSYEEVDSTTKVFDEAALYEPGYTQMVYLKIENAGDIDFEYDMSVIPNLSTLVIGKNENGGSIDLTDHLKFGLVFDDTEEGLLEKTSDRDLARTYATKKLSSYSENGGKIAAGGESYAAIVLYMPEQVANEANYRGDTAPSVEVGIGVVANHIKD